MEKKRISIVWFKRDLRLRDHAPLAQAIREGLPVLLMYCFEPTLLAAPQRALRHGRFIWASLNDLRQQLAPKGIPLYIFHAEVGEVLQRLGQSFDIVHLFSHQETGLKVTYDRDRDLRRFCREQQIRWWEFGQDGVERGRTHRNGWEKQWESHMLAPAVHPELDHLVPLELPAPLAQRLAGSALPAAFKVPDSKFQPGGETYAWKYLRSFLEGRASDYPFQLSKPIHSRRSCSRLSPYLAWGIISAREVFQWSERRRRQFSMARPLKHFQDRLWWRSHYIQKLESEWEIEFRAINHALQDIDRAQDPALFEAWAEGRTGIPMVDASMRCLQQNGWLNFRMRAMLATFATFTLWQDWKPVAKHLARLFLDFEPGIHYGQFQMQAGLSGYHPLRIFNPIIQGEQHDPEGAFIRQYVPELQSVPTPQLYAPWTMTPLEQQAYHCVLNRDYPAPLVHYEEATRRARDRYWAFRQRDAVKGYLPALWRRHCLPGNAEKYHKAILQH